jgi:hypothetical protein
VATVGFGFGGERARRYWREAFAIHTGFDVPEAGDIRGHGTGHGER